jgi:hypothetical protein
MAGSEWKDALDGLTAQCKGRSVTIEVIDEEVGHQPEVERLPFSYATYDPKDDVAIVAVGGDDLRYPVVLRHMVSHPAQIDVATDLPEPAVRIVETDGTVTLVTFYEDKDAG